MSNSPLSKNLFLVKEHVGMFKAASNYDIFDPSSGEMIMTCREENLGWFTKIMRFTDYKRMTPFDVEVRDMAGNLIVQVKRGTTFFRSVVEVFNGSGVLIGKFRQKMLSLGGKFQVLDAQDEMLCEVKGKWTGWEFKFGLEDVQFGMVSKKWSGFGKEIFTSADNYMLSIDETLEADHPLRELILAAVMCIDFVLKE